MVIYITVTMSILYICIVKLTLSNAVIQVIFFILWLERFNIHLCKQVPTRWYKVAGFR